MGWQTRVMWAVGVVAVPLGCVFGVLALGRQLEESDVAQGTLVDAREVARRAAEARARFLAMTPAEHVTAARGALHQPSRWSQFPPGNLVLAREHLGAFDAGVVEGLDACRAELAATEAAHLRAESALGDRLGQHVLDATRDRPAASLAARAAVAEALRARTGAPCIHERGAEGTTLVLGGLPCSSATVTRLTGGAAREALQRVGFRAVSCEVNAAATTTAL